MPVWMAVEDELDISEVILGMFEIWGIVGMSFTNGKEAIDWIDEVDALKVNQNLPELALIDIRLPEISGLEVSARIRQSKWLSHIGIVLTTAYRLTPDEETLALAQAQADALIYKPLPAMPIMRQLLAEILAKMEI